MIGYITSLQWLDYAYYSLVHPRGLKNLLQDGEKFLPFTFVIPFAVSFLEIMTLSSLVSQTNYFYYKITYGAFFLAIILFMHSLLFAGLLDTVFQLRGYPGKMKGLLSLVNLAYFPRFFLLPAVNIFTIIHFAPGFFYALFSLALFLWCLYIIVRGISEIYSIHFTRAIVMCSVPYLVMGVVVFFSLLLVILLAVGFIANV